MLAESRIFVFSDAELLYKWKEKRLDQDSCIYGIAYGVKKNALFQTLGWIFRKQHRASHTSRQEETVAAVKTLGCGRNVQSV